MLVSNIDRRPEVVRTLAALMSCQCDGARKFIVHHFPFLSQSLGLSKAAYSSSSMIIKLAHGNLDAIGMLQNAHPELGINDVASARSLVEVVSTTIPTEFRVAMESIARQIWPKLAHHAIYRAAKLDENIYEPAVESDDDASSETSDWDGEESHGTLSNTGAGALRPSKQPGPGDREGFSARESPKSQRKQRSWTLVVG